MNSQFVFKHPVEALIEGAPTGKNHFFSNTNAPCHSSDAAGDCFVQPQRDGAAFFAPGDK
jgi:hypothetical protein